MTPGYALSATGYVDRVLEEGRAEIAAPESEAKTGEDGAFYLLRLDTRLTRLEGMRTEVAVGGLALLDTVNYGTLSFEGWTMPRAGGGTWTARQSGVPLAPGWSANHEIGVTSTRRLPLFLQGTRVAVPASLVEGLVAEWRRVDDALTVHAMAGRPGVIEGGWPGRWKAEPGVRWGAGVQWGAGDAARGRWRWGAEFEAGQRLGGGPDAPAARVDRHAMLSGLRFERELTNVSAHLLLANGYGGQNTRIGAWVELSSARDPWRYSLSWLRLDRALHWAGRALADDTEAVQGRLAWQQRRRSVEMSIELLRRVSARAVTGHYVTFDWRERIDAESSLLVGGAFRRFRGEAVTAYFDWRTRLWDQPAGMRLQWSRGDGRPDEYRLSYDQQWSSSPALQLASTVLLGYARARAPEQEQGVYGGLALQATMPIGARGQLRAQFDHEDGGSRRRTSGSLFLSAKLGQGWQVELQAQGSHGQRRPVVTVDPLVPIEPIVYRSNSAQLWLRYQIDGGRAWTETLGGERTGAGRVEGIVFFDANRDGRREASEQGVPGAIVVLDDRYTARTDAEGRFSFPLVRPGRYSLQLRTDTLPLPWQASGVGRVPVDVTLRGTVQIELPVQRPD